MTGAELNEQRVLDLLPDKDRTAKATLRVGSRALAEVATAICFRDQGPDEVIMGLTKPPAQVVRREVPFPNITVHTDGDLGADEWKLDT